MSSSSGVVARYLDDLHEHGGLKGVDIANIMDVSKATVTRWKQGTFKPHTKTQFILSDLHYVVGRLEDYYSPSEIRSWLYAHHPQLDGERAIELICQNRSEEVLKVLERLDDEAYV